MGVVASIGAAGPIGAVTAGAQAPPGDPAPTSTNTSTTTSVPPVATTRPPSTPPPILLPPQAVTTTTRPTGPAGVLLPGGPAGPVPTVPSPEDEARSRAERAELAAELEVATASLAEVTEALELLDVNLRRRQAALDRSNERLLLLIADQAEAERALSDVRRRIRGLKAAIRQRAVEAYVDSQGGEDILDSVLSEDYLGASKQAFFLWLQSQSDAELGRRLDASQRKAARQQAHLTEAKEEAAELRERQQEQLAEALVAKAQQQALSQRVQAQIVEQLQRSILLSWTDRELAQEIAAQQALLNARLLAGSSSGVAADGSEGAIRLCEVNGITVNCLIERQTSEMVVAAAADGVTLTGGGYRSATEQIALRREHCGTTTYAVYEMSPGACRPSTARPGESMHEIGLAIDVEGARTRDTPAYRWLAANAARFGFYNLPDEPWHWSTTGT